MTEKSILELLRRLLALSQSPNEHEAAAAMAKAQELLFKHNLTMASVETYTNGIKDKPKIIKDFTDINSGKNNGEWKAMLVATIARNNFCEVLRIRNYDGSYQGVIIGQEMNTEVAKELYIWVAEQLEREVVRAISNYRGPDRLPTFKRAFFTGAIGVIGGRLRAQWDKLRRETETSTALVVRNELMIKDFMAEEYGKLRTGRATRNKSLDGRMAGREAGARADLTIKRKLGSAQKQLS